MGEDGRDGRGCAHRLARVLEALKTARIAKKRPAGASRLSTKNELTV
jgi:hypothetical protein